MNMQNMEFQSHPDTVEKIQTTGTLSEMAIGIQPLLMLRVWSKMHPDKGVDVNNPRDKSSEARAIRHEAADVWEDKYIRIFGKFVEDHGDQYHVDLRDPAAVDAVLETFADEYKLEFTPIGFAPAPPDESLEKLAGRGLM